MARRGRSRLPRGYYLMSTAKHGGFEVGGENTMPVVPIVGDYVTISGMGQDEKTTEEKVVRGLEATYPILKIGIGLLGLYVIARVLGLTKAIGLTRS